jgi:serine/threonine protein kinase
MCGITCGILHVHNQGILHNDIKSNNIVIEEKHGRVCPVLIDFGKATLMNESKGKVAIIFLPLEC